MVKVALAVTNQKPFTVDDTASELTGWETTCSIVFVSSSIAWVSDSRNQNTMIKYFAVSRLFNKVRVFKAFLVYIPATKDTSEYINGSLSLVQNFTPVVLALRAFLKSRG